MKIAGKMIIGFIIVALIAGAIGIVGILNLNTLDVKSSDMYLHQTKPLGALVDITTMYQRSRVAIRDLILINDTKAIQDEAANLQVKFDNVNTAYKEFEKNATDPEITVLLNDFKKKYDNYKGMIDQVIALALQNKDQEALDLLNGNVVDTAAGDVTKVIESLDNSIVAKVEATTVLNNQTGSTAMLTMIILVSVGVVFAVGLGLLISNSIRKPMGKIVIAAEKLAQGDVEVDVDVRTKDEAGMLAQAFGKVVSSIKILIADANMLTGAAQEGQLSTRADASMHLGSYRKIVDGINGTLEGITVPFEEFKAVLDRFRVNDYTLHVDGQYQGEIKEMADAINGTRERLLAVQSIFIEASKGDFSQYETYKQIGHRSENDQMIPSIIRLIESINAVIDEANMLTGAVMRGEVDLRGDTSRFEGRYKELIEGFNRLLDTIAKPLGETIGIMNTMAENDYTVEMNRDYEGAFGVLSQSINKVVETQNRVLHEINTAASQVAAGTKQVSDGSQTLSQGATEQAASIEELTSAITEIAAQTRQNAANAAEANQQAIAARNTASEGNEQMKDMLHSMDDINESSKSISKIIKVIDDIAFQTNILALNAAVEAARAGIHGKGFAVVAEEVRNLAGKSAEAAKETTNMIEDSIKRVEHGTKIANETAGALGQIVGSVEKAATLVAEIAIASNEQATGIAQVNQGIEQVAAVVQSNSATAEESAAASEELSGQADLLKGMVAQFKLKPDGTIQPVYIESHPVKAPKAIPAGRTEYGKY